VVAFAKTYFLIVSFNGTTGETLNSGLLQLIAEQYFKTAVLQLTYYGMCDKKGIILRAPLGDRGKRECGTRQASPVKLKLIPAACRRV
jgi:hypothetical protein